jgi:hypothetical protein
MSKIYKCYVPWKHLTNLNGKLINICGGGGGGSGGDIHISILYIHKHNNKINNYFHICVN